MNRKEKRQQERAVSNFTAKAKKDMEAFVAQNPNITPENLLAYKEGYLQGFNRAQNYKDD